MGTDPIFTWKNYDNSSNYNDIMIIHRMNWLKIDIWKQWIHFQFKSTCWTENTLTVSPAEGKNPPTKGVRPHSPKRRGIPNMTLNCIWWWGSSSQDLGSVEHSFIAITHWPTLTMVIYVSDACMSQIGLFKNYSYLIGSCAKNSLETTTEWVLHRKKAIP